MLRYAEAGDRDALTALYNVCFPGEPAHCNWFFDTLWKPERTLVMMRKDRIAAAVHMLPLTMRLEGVYYPAHYIYAAGTEPRFRGHGLMEQLLAHACADGVAAGQYFSALITQNDSLFDFYSRFGYKNLFRFDEHAISSKNPPPRQLVRAAKPEDFEAILRIYRVQTAHRLVPMRDALWFSHHLQLFGENCKVLLDKEGSVKAFCFIDGRVLKEAIGVEKRALAAACAAYFGATHAYTPAAESGRPMGCIKPLNVPAQKLLQRSNPMPYANILYN